MGRVTVDIEFANHQDVVRAADGTITPEEVRRVRVAGVIDTGANYLVLPERVATRLGVPTTGKATVRYADRRKATRPMVNDVELELLGRKATFQAIVEPKRKDALIGAIVLESLDLLVDCGKQKLHPRDPERIIAEIE